MVSPDLVRVALSRPIEWAQFESMVSEILLQDDFPNLRKMGGIADEGIDAIDEAFYDDELRTKSVVQITSQRTQKRKLRLTIKRLKTTDKQFDQLTIVFRHPIDSAIKRELRQEAFEEGILADFRDEDYLVGQLAKPNNGIFKRYFGDLRNQINYLLAQEDPLGAATDRIRHAMLASLAAFVINPSANTARINLFDQSILAIIVAQNGPVDIEIVQKELINLIPGKQVNTVSIWDSIKRLVAAGQCRIENGDPIASDMAIETIGSTIGFMAQAIDRIREKVLQDIALHFKIDDATKGRIERNVKRGSCATISSHWPDYISCIRYS